MDYKPKIKLSQDEFRVLASNTRIDILKLLDESQFTVSDISRKLDMNKATVHEHLSKLMEVGLVKKDDSPRKWVYYRLTWKGRNLLHPERVRVMVSLGIMLTVIVVGALIIAMQTDLDTNPPPDDPDIPTPLAAVDVFWEESGQANTYDIHLKATTALTIAQVKDLSLYVEPDAMSMTYRDPIDLSWAWESDIIHIYDYDEELKDHSGEYLYVEGTLLDDQSVERPFSLRRYLMPQGWQIDLRISAKGINIDISNLTDGNVSISFAVENVGNMEANDTLVEVFSVHSAFKPEGYPSYGSPYLWEIFNTTVTVPTNGSHDITFDIPVRQLYRRGIMVVVDPDNAMPEVPMDNNMVTQSIPDEIIEANSGTDAPTKEADEASMNLGFVAIMVAGIIFVVLIIVALLVLRGDR